MNGAFVLAQAGPLTSEFPADNCFAGRRKLVCFCVMTEFTPPNEAIAELVAAMGEENARKLIRTFLKDFPTSMQDLAVADRQNGRRIAHRMKGESRMMGAADLSRRMLEIQERLTPETGAPITPADLAAIAAEFETTSGKLRAYVEAEPAVGNLPASG